LEVIKRHPKEIILSAFARMAEQAPFYIFTAFIFSYGTGTLQVSRDFLLTAVLVASVLSFFSIPFFGHLSDRIGRKNMYMIGAVVTGIFGFVYFGMLNTGVTAIIFTCPGRQSVVGGPPRPRIGRAFLPLIERLRQPFPFPTTHPRGLAKPTTWLQPADALVVSPHFKDFFAEVEQIEKQQIGGAK